MKRIMFVCHGNICRSPMAEFVLKKKLYERGIAKDFTVESSATSTEEIWRGIGNPVYPPARVELLRHGIDPGGKRAVRLTESDAEKYDLFIGMDSANIRNMKSILGPSGEGKIFKLLDFTDRGGDVADPWYTGNFERTYIDVDEGCEGLLDAILNNKIQKK